MELSFTDSFIRLPTKDYWGKDNHTMLDLSELVAYWVSGDDKTVIQIRSGHEITVYLSLHDFEKHLNDFINFIDAEGTGRSAAQQN